MTPRISLRPARAAAVLITFAAVVLALLSVTALVSRGSVERVPFQAAAQDAPGHALKQIPVPTVSPASHRSSVQTAERRVTAAAVGQGAEMHYPGGPPDVVATPAGRGWFLPADFVDLPVDASAQVIATAVSVSHRGRAPPISGNGV